MRGSAGRVMPVGREIGGRMPAFPVGPSFSPFVPSYYWYSWYWFSPRG